MQAQGGGNRARRYVPVMWVRAQVPSTSLSPEAYLFISTTIEGPRQQAAESLRHTVQEEYSGEAPKLSVGWWGGATLGKAMPGN